MSNFYNQTTQSSLRELKTSINGLSAKEVAKRLKKHGFNELTKEKQISKWEILFSQFMNPLIYILLITSLISFLLKEYLDMSVILAAVFLNATIGFFQENKANNSLSKLKKLVKNKAFVLRDGVEIKIDSRELVPGDIIILSAGNKVPADARLLEITELQTEESNLTGESFPSVKNIKKQRKGAALADRKNMVYASTVIAKGRGKAVVTATAENTEIGKISQMVQTTAEEKTPLQLRLERLSNFLGILIAGICLLVIGIGVWQGRDFFEMFITGVAIAVASIPEGLVVAVTVILVLGMQRILKKKALTRKLVAAETLGSTTVICTDKTGTLTEGKMHVAHIISGKDNFSFLDKKADKKKLDIKNINLALSASVMCNNAVVENPKDELAEWRIIGDPTERALLSAAVQSGIDRDVLQAEQVRVSEKPFSSEDKFMITIHRQEKDYILYEKGAPEKLLAKASYFCDEEKSKKITDEKRKELNKIYEDLTGRGLRVIGVAFRNIKKEEFEKLNPDDIAWSEIDKELHFIGFLALKDPLRAEAKETIKNCRMAGIKPVIITGDHKLTAKAIAAEIGLEAKAENVMIGDMLDKIDDRELQKIVNKINIYARVSPHHKLRIVKALQACDEVVAMVGDGINDSPALKAADIGVALGTGTDIAKESADIVLLDNNFKTIVDAVKQGRVIFSNIQKVITYLISDSFSEVILISGSILLGMPLAILPVQILWINIINDGLPDFSLAFEKGDDSIMHEKPISKKAPIINKEMKIIIFGAGLIRDFFIFGIFYYLLKHSFPEEYVRTVVFAAIGVDSLMYIFCLRNLRRPLWRINPFSNLYLVGAVLISLALLLVSIYWPPLQAILSTTSLSFNSWVLILSTGFMSIVMIEIVKHFFLFKDETTHNS